MGPIKRGRDAVRKSDRPDARARRARTASRKPIARTSVPHAFAVVGIGASAGGLEALERFFENVPQACGLAFVVVQHMDPTHKGLLVELLQRVSAMPVAQARDGSRVEPGNVYVIPPNKDLAIRHGSLHLLAPAGARGRRLPIDSFFQTLAEDQGEHAVGVILSGMGSDGTLGLRAIKEKGGRTFAETPASAKFDSMPRSAIDAGQVDGVAPAHELVQRILGGRRAPTPSPASNASLEAAAKSAIEQIVGLLQAETGHDFSLYKRNTIYRRIERRMGLHQLDALPAYLRYLRDNPKELQLLFRELLIGVTSFFRDPDVWEKLRGDVLPTLLGARAAGSTVRAWVTGCSTGEEAYTLAIVLREAIAALEPPRKLMLQVFATDLDPDAIERARQGVYPASIAAEVSPERLRRFFVADPRGYRVNAEVRERIVFAVQNVIQDPPFTKLDLLVCRNVLIYLSPALQQKLLPLFHYSLRPGGVLVLGTSETVGGFTGLFAQEGHRSRVYHRLEQGRAASRPEVPSSPTPLPRARVSAAAEIQAMQPSFQSQADRLLLQRFGPAAVLANDRGDVLYISGRIGAFLEPAAGKANWNVFAMARGGLANALEPAFRKAFRKKQTVIATGVRMDRARRVDVTIEPLKEPPSLRGTAMVLFAEVGKPAAPPPERLRGARGATRESELRVARDELHATREEMQIAAEELTSTNEELQSANEELQSTNEELTTSKEEMQSMNEELQSLNHELQAKVDELLRASSDMKNLLDSTDIATLFLDGDLNVRRFTTQMAKLIKLIPSDAGRPITDLAQDFIYPDLHDDAREVLRRLVSAEKQVGTKDGRWFTVRIMPYRTLDNRIDGAVITFLDISAAKALEANLRRKGKS